METKRVTGEDIAFRGGWDDADELAQAINRALVEARKGERERVAREIEAHPLESDAVIFAALVRALSEEE